MTKSVILGTASITSIEATQHLPIDEVVKLAIQIIVGIATLIKLFKKEKEKK